MIEAQSAGLAGAVLPSQRFELVIAEKNQLTMSALLQFGFGKEVLE